MVYPVHFFDEVIAAACLGSYQTHAFPDSAPSMIDPMIYMLRNAMLHGKSLEALSDSEMNFKHLVTHGISAIAIVNAEGVVVFANKLFEKLSGYHADEFQSKTVFFKSFFNESQQNLVVTQILAKLDKSNASTLCNLEFIDKSEKTIAVECAARPTIWYSRACTFILIRDISERKRMERDLLQIDEWERVRIAQDLHDSVGQQIAGMAYLVEVLAKNLNQSQSVYADSASQLTGIARAAHAQLRDITKGLLPLAGSGTLADALKSLCEQMRLQTSANCAVVDEGLGQIDLDAVTANHLRYIAQEAIANAVRHGNAKNVRSVLLLENEQGILRIDDDGCGFDLGHQRFSGSGLRIMEYRAGIIGGKLSIKRGTPRGMSVCCTFNLATVIDRVNLSVNI